MAMMAVDLLCINSYIELISCSMGTRTFYVLYPHYRSFHHIIIFLPHRLPSAIPFRLIVVICNIETNVSFHCHAMSAMMRMFVFVFCHFSCVT